jgi:hypothetical protein
VLMRGQKVGGVWGLSRADNALACLLPLLPGLGTRGCNEWLDDLRLGLLPVMR